MDLVRRILQEMETAPFDGEGFQFEVPDTPEDVLQYHLTLMSEAGLIDGIDTPTHDGPGFLPVRLTWLGHEFLEASRSDTLWEKAKRKALSATGGLTFHLMSQILKALAKDAVSGAG